MTNFHQRIIEIAAGAISEKPRQDKFNHATLIFNQKRLISIGVNNQYKTHTKAYKDSPEWSFKHSELSCIIRFKNTCGIDLSKTTGFNVRIGKSGKVLLSRPCILCQKLIIAANFKNFYYTNNLGLFEQFIFR